MSDEVYLEPSGNHQLPPTGPAVVTLVSSEAVTPKPDPFNPGKMTDQVKLMTDVLASDGRTYQQPVWVNRTIHEKSNLAEIIFALSGQIPTARTAISTYYGKKAGVIVKHRVTRAGKTRAKLTNWTQITPSVHGVDASDGDLPKGMF